MIIIGLVLLIVNLILALVFQLRDKYDKATYHLVWATATLVFLKFELL